MRTCSIMYSVVKPFAPNSSTPFVHRSNLNTINNILEKNYGHVTLSFEVKFSSILSHWYVKLWNPVGFLCLRLQWLNCPVHGCWRFLRWCICRLRPLSRICAIYDDNFRQKVNFRLIFRIYFLVRCFLFDASFSAEGKKLVLEKHCWCMNGRQRLPAKSLIHFAKTRLLNSETN